MRVRVRVGLGLYFLGRVETFAYVVFFVAHTINHLDYRKRQDKTRQDKTRQDKTRQDKTRQDKTRQDKTRQDSTKSELGLF